jgi:hypothetical protein
MQVVGEKVSTVVFGDCVNWEGVMEKSWSPFGMQSR